MLIKRLISRLHSWLATNLSQPNLASTERGSALVATIIAMTIAAALGTAIYSFVATSSFTQIGSMNDTKAYYLAEAGGLFGIKRLGSLLSAGAVDLSNHDALLAALPATSPYVVSDAGQFTLEFPASYYSHPSPGVIQIKFISTGSLIGDNSVNRAITYILNFADPAGVAVPIDNLNPNNWNANGPTPTATPDVATNPGTGDAQISLDWTNPDSNLPKLLDVWNDSNKLLTYEAQIKIKLGTTGTPPGADVMSGLSFRLNTGGNTNVADDSFYGLSYLWCESNATGRDLLAFCGSETSKTYIVLWRQDSDGSKHILGKRLASDVTSGLVSGNALVDWATLVVRLQEQFNLTTGLRENMIYAFIGVPTTSPKGTIHWDYTKYLSVQWDLSLAGADAGHDCSGGQNSFISDATFTSANFDTIKPDEVGIHALGRAKSELTDLAIRFNFNGGIATPCVASAPGTIKMSASSYTATESGGTVTISATRTLGSAGTVGISYATSDNTALAGSDYTATSGTLTWANNDTATKTFTIPILDDAGFESSETFNLTLSTPTGSAILATPNTAEVTITDDDGVTPCDNWPNTALSSGTSSLSGTFTASTCTNRLLVCAVTSELSDTSSSFTVTGNYGGQNFTTLCSTSGLSTRQHVWLGYVKDAGITARSGNTITTSISAGQSRSGSNLYCATYKGVDQTTPIPIAGSRANYNSGNSTISYGGSVAVTEGGAIFYVSAANGAKSTPPTGYLEYWDNTLSSYSQAGGSKKITATGSENPSWKLTASDRWGLAAASLNPALGGGNSGTIEFSLASYSVAEDGATATITVTRTGGSVGAVGVSYSTSNGKATAGSDYTASSGTLSWAAGDVADKTFTIPILDDMIYEGAETVNLTITTPTGGATLGSPNTAILTITDNEAPPTEGTSRTYYMTFNTGTTLGLPSTVTTNTNCPSGSDTALAGASGNALLGDADSTTCVPSSNRDVTWSSATPSLSLYYNGSGYSTAMNITGTSVVIRGKNQSSGTAVLTAKLFYTAPGNNNPVYFTGTAPTIAMTTTRALKTFDLSGLSATNVPIGSKIGVKFTWADTAGTRLAVNPSDVAADKLIVVETAL